MWEFLEERERQLSIMRPPDNIFEQHILWTEQGKLWKFPIDNEQGENRALDYYSSNEPRLFPTYYDYFFRLG